RLPSTGSRADQRREAAAEPRVSDLCRAELTRSAEATRPAWVRLAVAYRSWRRPPVLARQSRAARAGRPGESGNQPPPRTLEKLRRRGAGLGQRRRPSPAADRRVEGVLVPRVTHQTRPAVRDPRPPLRGTRASGRSRWLRPRPSRNPA